MEGGGVGIRNYSATELNRWDKQRPIEQANEYEGVFKGDALAAERAMRKIAQELLALDDSIGAFERDQAVGKGYRLRVKA